MRHKLLVLIALVMTLIVLPEPLILSETPPPTLKYASSAIAITPDGSRVVAVNPDSNSISIMDTTTYAVTEIPVGVDPRAVTVHNAWAYVANQGSDSVIVVDLDARVVLGERAVGDRPVGIALSPDKSMVAVAELGSDTVRLLDSSSLDTISVLPVPDRPHGLAFTPDGVYLLVTHLLSGNVTVIPLNPTGEPGTIATWANVAPAPAVIVNEAGDRAYLPQTMAHGLGLNTQFDNSVFAKVSVLNLTDQTHQTSEHISLPETDQPVGLPWDAALAGYEPTELWVVNAGSNDISVIDIRDPARPQRAAHITVSDNPRGIVISVDGAHAYVNNTLAGTISVIDTATYTVIDEIAITELPLPPLLLDGKRLFFSSARPELARAAWISCNTCHIEGEHDGRTWQLQYTGDVPPGEKPIIVRNTTSLLGMIETYPLRWSAEWDESADSEFSIRFEQYGEGLIAGDMHPTLGTPNQGRAHELDALAAYIDSLAVPDRAHTLTAAEERGRLIFESPETECATCHPAPIYTNLHAYDVGTANGLGEWFGPEIDTPTLRFLYDSAPYLHDGSAPTLRAILTTANPSDEHGVTSHLTDQQLDDLIAFLLALPYSQ